MARKRGPIGRVRNIRNGDPSAIPLPYPKLITVLAFHSASNTLLLTLSSADTQNTILDYGREWENGTDIFCQSIGFPVTFTRISIEGNPLQYEAIFSSDPENDNLVVLPWSQGYRGKNGEWIAPSQTFIGPVV